VTDLYVDGKIHRSIKMNPKELGRNSVKWIHQAWDTAGEMDTFPSFCAIAFRNSQFDSSRAFVKPFVRQRSSMERVTLEAQWK
jgi:hypothetical protein